MTVRTRKITDREEWLRWRGPNVNASESGALLGIDAHCTPLQLYHRKLGTIGPEEENEAMRRGRWLEPAVLKATAELRPDLTITTPNCYIDDPTLRVGCTPDAFATDDKGRLGVIQAKTVGENVFKAWVEEQGDKASAAPLAYELQTMIEAVQTTRADFALMGLMIVGYRVNAFVLPVPIITRAWDTFLKRVKRFWVDVEKRRPPPVTAPDDADLLKKLYPGQPGLTVDLTGNNALPELLEKHEDLAAALKAARALLKPIEKEYEAVRTEIKAIVGDAETAYLPSSKIATFKEQTNPGWTARVLRISTVKERKQ